MSQYQFNQDFLRDLTNIQNKYLIRQGNGLKKENKKMGFDPNSLTKCHSLGIGCFGTVYRVYEEQLGLWLALKSIPKYLARIHPQYVSNELKIQTYVNHPNLTKSYGFYADNHSINILMQLCIGIRLSEFRPDGNQILKISTQIFSALKYLHQHKIIHRDLKPENIIVDQQCNIKICDFGLACHFVQNSNIRDSVGTVEFMAPEMATGMGYDYKIDIWSVGIILYELCTGKHFMQGLNAVDKFIYLLNYSDIDSSCIQNSILRNLVSRCLKRNPEERATADNLLEYLEHSRYY